MPDRIILKDMLFWGRHGVLPRERQRRQPFRVDVVLYVDVSSASASDELNDSVDYALVFAQAKRLLEGTSHRLLETLAARLAHQLLELAGVQGAQVTVKKLQVPLDGDLAYAAVEVERWRGR